MNEVMRGVELAFKEKGHGRVQMPAKNYLFYKKHNGDLRTMPSYLEELKISAVKIVNVHPENKIKYSLPTVMAVIVLIDPKNGAPIAIMGGTSITDMRTGAAGGIAAKYLAKKNSKKVGLVGAGAQARTQLMALIEVYKKLKIKVWSRKKATKRKFVDEASSTYGDFCEITPVDTLKEAVIGSDIIVTTTPSRQPLILDYMVSTGMHFNCIGADAPGKEELDPNILKKSKIIIDDWEQASHSGEINVPLSQQVITRQNVWAEIGEVIAGLKSGRKNPEEITIFTSTGLAVQDAITARIAYDKAIKQGIGQFVQIT